MKKLIPIIVIIAFLICPLISSASYLVQLKNGGKFITYHYWEEGNQIKFYIYGGVMGIDKDFVRKVKESDLVYREETVEQKVAIERPEALSIQTEAKTQTASASVKSKKENDQFIKEFNLLKERFKDIESMTTPELYKFADDLTNFKKKVLSSGVSHIYNAQLLEIYSMVDEVEAIIKAKGQ